MSKYRWLAEIDGHDKTSHTVITTRVSDGAFITQPGEAPPNTVYEPRLIQPALMQRDAFDALTTSGKSRMGYGDCVLGNVDGGLDTMANYAVDGRTIIIRRAKITGPPPAYPGGFTTALQATMDVVQNAPDTLTFKLRDQQYKTQVPFQPTKYLGNNALPAGLEGVADLLGKPKPVLLGKVKNITPICVNTSKQIYQINDGAFAVLDAVRDGGGTLVSGSPQWTTTASPVTIPGYICVYGGGLWLIITYLGDVWTSPDKTTWTHRALLTGGGVGGFSNPTAAWNGTSWLVAGAMLIWTSPDAVTWTSHATPIAWANRPSGVAWSVKNALWLAGVNGTVYTSPDGVTWTSRIVGTAINYFVEGFGLVVGYGGAGNIYSSYDCITWTQRATDLVGGTDTNIYAMVFTGALFCGVGVTAVTSNDGITWRRTVAPWAAVGTTNAVYADGRITAFSSDAKGYNSFDGVTWTLLPVTVWSVYALGVTTDGTTVLTVDHDGGIAFTSSLPYANTAALLNDALAPAPGGYVACLSAGYFRLGTKPTFALTCDATQGATAANRTAAQLASQTIQRAGQAFSAGDLIALDALNSAVCGWWSGTNEILCDAVIDLFAQTVGAWWAPDAVGVFHIQRLDVPSGAPDVAFVKEEFLTPLAPVPSNDANGGIPAYQTVIRGARNFTVQTSGFADKVDAVTRAQLALEWQDGIATDNTVLTHHPLSQPIIVESTFATQADAQTEATRRQAIFGADQRWFQPIVELDDANMALDLGKIAQLTHDRYGLSGGGLFRILGLLPDASNNTLTLSCWGLVP